MAYDEALADRIRDLLYDAPNLSEKRMFGGLAFLINGNMALAASGQGGILVRVKPDEAASLVAGSGAEVAIMRGREMSGWLRVDAEHVKTERQLARWVLTSKDFALSLPKK
jgi:TfoX/Sxy family transcriptional regulator of competence genes